MERTRSFKFQFSVPPQVLFRYFVDPKLLAKWKVPDGMTMDVHSFEAKVGGKFRVSLTYREDLEGKSGEHTDTYSGYFAELDPGVKIVEVMEFETDKPEMKGEMKITTRFSAVDGGTEVLATHEGLPRGVRFEDNELGWNMSFEKLASLVRA